MEPITIQNIEKTMTHFLENKPFTMDNLKTLVLLGDAMKCLSHTHREFTMEDAKEWISAMNPPARWTLEQTTDVMNLHGYHHRPCEFWVAMNALFSDYGKTAAKFGVDRAEFWAELAHDFIDDPDAEDMKVGRYWRDILRKS